MTKTLLWKTVFIVSVTLAFAAGIFFGPMNNWSSSWQALHQGGLGAAVLNNIHLGLDLKGGTHLILQVKVNDAVNADSDQAVERLKSDLKSRNIAYAAITKPDPTNNPDEILIQGVPSESIGDVRSLVSDRLAEYDMTSGANNTFTLRMKPSQLTDLKNRAVQQAIETIRNRIDKLGVSEPLIEEHGLGQYQILVQLPGVDDPARVKEIMQSTAMLEIRQAFGGPHNSEQEALQSHNGVLPPDTVLLPGKSSAAGAGNDSGQAWYIVSRTSAVAGHDLRDANMTRDENGRPAVGFDLTGEGGRRFYAFTSAHVGDQLAVVLDNKVQEVANI